jgi:hypothetical protein
MRITKKERGRRILSAKRPPFVFLSPAGITHIRNSRPFQQHPVFLRTHAAPKRVHQLRLLAIPRSPPNRVYSSQTLVITWTAALLILRYRLRIFAGPHSFVPFVSPCLLEVGQHPCSSPRATALQRSQLNYHLPPLAGFCLWRHWRLFPHT